MRFLSRRSAPTPRDSGATVDVSLALLRGYLDGAGLRTQTDGGNLMVFLDRNVLMVNVSVDTAGPWVNLSSPVAFRVPDTPSLHRFAATNQPGFFLLTVATNRDDMADLLLDHYWRLDYPDQSAFLWMVVSMMQAARELETKIVADFGGTSPARAGNEGGFG